MTTPNLNSLSLSDSEEDDTSELFASPTRAARNKQKTTTTSTKLNDGAQSRNGESKYDAEAAREAALKRELEGVRNINEVIEGVLSSLEVAKGNMDTVSRTVNNASTLLNTWTSILSQTEHNQRLLLNPNWKGASADIADLENEQVLKAQAAERRAAEEERRKEDAKRRVEEEERQRQAGTTVTRGRGTGRVRGSAATGRGRGGLSSSGYVAGGSRPGGSVGSGRGIPTPGSTSSKGSSGIGRGVGRGRARGGAK